MCKRHWKAVHWRASDSTRSPKKGGAPQPPAVPPPPFGESVYEHILPQSISYKPTGNNSLSSSSRPVPAVETAAAALVATAGARTPETPSKKPSKQAAASSSKQTSAQHTPTPNVMPLVAFLKKGRGESSAAGWHRNAERRAWGMFPAYSRSMQLEPWERQLALVETLLLSGGTPFANFRDLAQAWGRDKGFHHQLVSQVCDRRGEVELKKRCDAGLIKSAGAVTRKSGTKRKSPSTTPASSRQETVANQQKQTPEMKVPHQQQQMQPPPPQQQQQQQPALLPHHDPNTHNQQAYPQDESIHHSDQPPADSMMMTPLHTTPTSPPLTPFTMESPPPTHHPTTAHQEEV